MSVEQDVIYTIVSAESLSVLQREVQKILDDAGNNSHSVRCEGGIMIDRAYTRAMGNNGAVYAQLVICSKEVSPIGGIPFGMEGRAG